MQLSKCCLRNDDRVETSCDACLFEGIAGFQILSKDGCEFCLMVSDFCIIVFELLVSQVCTLTIRIVVRFDNIPMSKC